MSLGPEFFDLQSQVLARGLAAGEQEVEAFLEALGMGWEDLENFGLIATPGPDTPISTAELHRGRITAEGARFLREEAEVQLLFVRAGQGPALKARLMGSGPEAPQIL